MFGFVSGGRAVTTNLVPVVFAAPALTARVKESTVYFEFTDELPETLPAPLEAAEECTCGPEIEPVTGIDTEAGSDDEADVRPELLPVEVGAAVTDGVVAKRGG